MPFQPKKTRNKVESAYKSIYLRQTVIDEIDKLAAQHRTSFNNIVVTMIEQCLEDIHREQQEQPPQDGMRQEE